MATDSFPSGYPRSSLHLICHWVESITNGMTKHCENFMFAWPFRIVGQIRPRWRCWLLTGSRRRWWGGGEGAKAFGTLIKSCNGIFIINESLFPRNITGVCRWYVFPSLNCLKLTKCFFLFSSFFWKYKHLRAMGYTTLFANSFGEFCMLYSTHPSVYIVRRGGIATIPHVSRPC